MREQRFRWPDALYFVIPAQAGIHLGNRMTPERKACPFGISRIHACAGMTDAWVLSVEPYESTFALPDATGYLG